MGYSSTPRGNVKGPASSTVDALVRYSDTTGKNVQDTSSLVFNTGGQLQNNSLTGNFRLVERGTAPITAATYGYVWVKNTAPTTLIFTNDGGTDFTLGAGAGNNIALGEWSFGSSTLGVTGTGTFDTDNASLLSITTFRFNNLPTAGDGQNITSWADQLPQAGILYLQDVTDPGGTSVTFTYNSLTFPIGASWAQFSGVALISNGTILGTNWSANKYSLQILPANLVAVTGTRTDNALLVTDGVVGNATSEADIIYVSPKLTIQGTGGGEISMLQRATAPVGVTNYGSFWVSDEVAGPRPAFTREDGLDYFLGYKEIQIHGRPDFGLAQNQWYSWDPLGWPHDLLWSSPNSLGSGASPTLTVFWEFNGIYFPNAATLISVDWTLSWQDGAVGPSYNMELRGVQTLNGATAAGTQTKHASHASFFSASTGQINRASMTIDTPAIPSDSRLFFCHRRTTVTAATVDPEITVVIRYVET